MLYLPALIVAAVLLACAVVVLAVSEKAEATFPGKNGRIAYASYDAPLPKGDSEIYTIRADGSGKRQLTNNYTDDLDPAYSPDGKKIVYAGASRTQRTLTRSTPSTPAGEIRSKSPITMWTRSGLPTRLPARGSLSRTDRKGAWRAIYQIMAGGGGMTLLARNGGVPSYSPDGERIAYECYGRGPRIDTDICIISVRRDHKLPKFIPEKPAGSTLHDVLHDKVHVTNNDTDDFNPDYSPDGREDRLSGLRRKDPLRARRRTLRPTSTR